MNRRYRKTIIAGNWKMNKTPAETKVLLEEIKGLVSKAKWCDICCCVPFVDIFTAVKTLKDTRRVSVGAQNLHQESAGAYTGEVSADMLKGAGVKYVIVGHSERRQYFGETDALVAKKAANALAAGLKAIVCVGETLEQREMGITLSLITTQVLAALSSIKPEELRNVVFAYEPVWAIGTGVTATADQAAEVCAHIRAVIRKKYDSRTSRSMSILYGGSMNADNASELLSREDIDGGLIGGASLKAADFMAIVAAANQ